MATQSSSRTRTKQPPSFPRDRQQQQPQPDPSTPLTQPPFPQSYFIPPSSTTQPYIPTHSLPDLEAWRLQTVQSATTPSSAQPRRSSRGPRASSPVPSLDSSSARFYSWDVHSARYRRKSVTSNTSSSDHHHLRSPRPVSRSPSPATPRTSLSPRTLRTPASANDLHKRPPRKMTNGSTGTGSFGPPCALETALVNSRRRIPYSVGSEPLAQVSPDQYHAKLDEKDERCLSVDIEDLYHVYLHHPSANGFSNYYRLRTPNSDDDCLLKS